MKLAQVPTSAFQSGKVHKIEHYSFNTQDLIGQGFSSQVYRGKDERTNEDVAIKVIDMRKITNEVESSLLHQEIHALQIMESPNVVKMLQHQITPQYTYIITEFCNQGDLGKAIKRNQHLNEMEAIKILKHIVNGFKEQVTKGIIHRDLKPINILIKNGIPKLADYGFSKMMNAPKETVYYNVGTALYMSPQTMVLNQYSEKSDVWSIGVIYYEMLFGRVPFQAATEKDLAQVICKTEPVFHPEKPISKESMDFIRRCLTVDANKRITCAELEHHPIFFRRNTMAVQRPLTNNNRSTSINNTRSPQRSTEYQQRPTDMRVNLVGKSGITKSALRSREHQSMVASNDETISVQLQFIQLMYRILKVLDKCEGTQHESNQKLKFFVVKNMLIKAILLKELVEKKHNTLDLQDFTNYTDQIDKYATEVSKFHEQAKLCFDKMYTIIEQNHDQKQILLKDRTFKMVYEDLSISESYEFYLLLSAYLKKAIRELLNNCNMKLQHVPDEQALPLVDEAQVYLLEQLTYYHILVKLIVENHNNVALFTKRSNLHRMLNQRHEQLTKGNLQQIKQSIMEMKI